ncbi:MAG: glycosyltransferase family A protein [Eubacterium ramulus]
MERCIDSLLPGGEDVEIIIVDDGSTIRPALLRMSMPESILPSFG